MNNTYRIEALLGRGGVSEVYKARSEISGRVVAVKALRAEFARDEDFLSLMTREEDVREIRHDAVVRYFDAQRMADGVVYLVMDYVEGPGMDSRLASGGMTADELMTAGQRIAGGLAAAHARNIVHRDLSPDNIILKGGSPAEAVIIDFGIAKDTNPGAETIVGDKFAGKYAYAAPEQLAGKADPRTDIYSLGALLLATFRGRKPEIGRNPMEVLERKRAPLDLEGVPEPLRRLLGKMTAPDPEDRFQSAEELLSAFRDPDSVPPLPEPEPDLLDELLSGDATVIAPAMAAPAPEPSAAPASAGPAPRRGRGGLAAAGLALLLAAAGAGAWYGGLLDGLTGPAYPVADPYALIIERRPDGETRAVGNVPSEEMLQALAVQMQELGGTSDLTLASGDIPDGWGEGMLALLADAGPLEEFRISALGPRVNVAGLAPTRQAQSEAEAAFGAGAPAGLEVSARIGLGPRLLPAAALDPVLAANADCGPLQLEAPPAGGYGLNDAVAVTGQLAGTDSRTALEAALQGVAGDRPVRVDAAILNDSLCRVDAVLPEAAPGNVAIRFGDGGSGADNPSAVYHVGDNPVIDIRLPEDLGDGYLWVSIVDVKGVVFHMLPNRLRPDNAVSALRAEAEDGWVRVAYPAARAAEGVIAFTVDDSVLGKSKILVLFTRDRIFDEFRPVTESAESYADALAAVQARGGLGGYRIDTAILTTEN
nr:serine/threonine protein kinase [Mangrovicoccus sp. HB161399]